MLTPALENALIERLTSRLPRSPLQLNKLQESDAEVLLLPGGGQARIALTTDTLAEEIRTGLYADPWLIGWMSVMANMSDLAAVGAEPLGILIAETLPADTSQAFLSDLQRGIADACTVCGSYVLGGDTNIAEAMSITGCAVGLLSGGRTLTRRGCRPGDLLYCSGPLGVGNAYALSHFSGQGTSSFPYRPQARLREGQLLRNFASACMDTSDGLTATVDQLMRINGIGFHLHRGWEMVLEPVSRASVQKAGLPHWLLLAGIHGEFELVFTIPPGMRHEFICAAAAVGWSPCPLGDVIDTPELRIWDTAGDFVVDTGELRNLGHTAGADFSTYLNALLAIDARSR